MTAVDGSGVIVGLGPGVTPLENGWRFEDERYDEAEE